MSFKQFGLRVISGEETSLRGTVVRAFAGVVEPVYSCVMRLRNAAYDRGKFQIHDLGRPTISIGNITTGGTGKTPVVIWLASHLREQARRPAILLRGYGAKHHQFSDEAALLDQSLNSELRPIVWVQANPSRVFGAMDVLQEFSEADVFLLDDAFQHRQARRDFNLVLISATQPFGFGHVLPRGLLREPLSGLARADAFLITRCSLVTPEAVAEIDRYLADHHPTIPVFHADHALAGIWIPATGETLPMESIAGQKVFLTAAIGDPDAFARQIESLGCQIVGRQWFADHHAFSASEIELLVDRAKSAGADRLLTTEKDWVKVKQHAPSNIAVVKLDIRFHADDGTQLSRRIEEAITRVKPAMASPVRREAAK